MKNDIGLYSKEFDDIYFSPEDGIGESKAVFLDGINAPECWKDKKAFTVSELGFGSGLNFLLTAKLWCETTSPDQQLIYYSTEKYPLDKSQIEVALEWQDLQPYVSELLEDYPNNDFLFNGRIKLKILLGDSLEQLRFQNFKSDAWYLDGFAPSKNPDMWSDEIFNEMARLSNQKAQVATFTAAGFVKRGLQKVGFQMDKRPGFGKKREMLTGFWHKKSD
ncbi:tRNA (5-methylaminomethyl-2-thiouridine)(34)-methyltransferase MnmD [Emcibacteraceae bacterium]|nr:tRNA (5-methylaminomethyl-2-thiouridine)(34)-methyltransferase MnmD [Emcibacteraceae bacterium]